MGTIESYGELGNRRKRRPLHALRRGSLRCAEKRTILKCNEASPATHAVRGCEGARPDPTLKQRLRIKMATNLTGMRFSRSVRVSSSTFSEGDTSMRANLTWWASRLVTCSIFGAKPYSLLPEVS